MGTDYTEAAIRARIEGRGTPSGGPAAPDGIALLIDIQQKILDGKGPAYERWAKVFNLKQAAKTLSYLQENGGMTVDALAEKVQAATVHANDLETKVKVLDDVLRDNAALQRHIVNYSKTRDVYTQYRKAGYSKKFRAAHAKEIMLHQEANSDYEKTEKDGRNFYDNCISLDESLDGGSALSSVESEFISRLEERESIHARLIFSQQIKDGLTEKQ